MPGIINLLEKEASDDDKDILSDFSGLIRTLLLRFPPKPPFEAKYNNIKIALSVSITKQLKFQITGYK